ncbi:hypothetical protein [Clostridium sp. VAP41]|uniref:hypothetical protein n=1 Tax=Clostridium sp. VAP41 TaxID=2949979 RepID=UPI002079C21E|nr:hypothetical protein [Clostridium sp. VAP41]
MDFSVGNLVKSVVGAVVKVANAVVNTVKSAISGISEILSSTAGTIGSALSGAMAALGVVDVDEDGELDIDDAEEFLEEKFKLLVGASIFSFVSGSSENDCDDSSESMWDKAKNMARDFTIGAGYSIDENMSFGMVMSIANKREEELPDSASCKAGRIFGDIWSLIGSGLEIGGGSAEAMGGVVLDSSGVGAVAGVPLNISRVAIAADGVINAERSLTSLANDTMTFISNKSSNGGSGKSGSNETSHVQSSEISEKAIKSIKKKWGQKGVDAFEKAMNKGIVGAEGQNGIKPLKGKPYKGKYTHEIKVKNKEYGDFRIYGYKDSSGKMIFECFDKGLH